jgi:hypothetical protein
VDIRKKFLELDCRRALKGNPFCYICNKDIKTGSPYCMIHVISGGWWALDPEDEDKHTPGAGECGVHPVGMNYTRDLEKEWLVAAV